MTVDGISQAIDALYEAALDEARWHGALQELATATGSQAATFWVLDASDTPRHPVFSYVNLDPCFIGEYLSDMAPHDPTLQYLVANPGLPIVHDSLFITEREKDRHFYYDWHHRYSDTRFRLVSRMNPAPGVQAGVTLLRDRAAGRFERDEVEQFKLLHRHIERALVVGFQLGSLGTMQQCSLELLDRNPLAIVLLDASGRVVHANSAAVRLCRSRDGLSMAKSGLQLGNRVDNDRFRKLIERALAIRAADAVEGDPVMQVSRPSRKRPYLLLVTPMSGCYPGLSALRPAVCVMITDPDAQTSTSVECLRTAFNLTQAEAQLAAMLATGKDLQMAAAMLSIRYSTARTRLAEVFRKTGTRRQGELVNLLLKTVPLGEGSAS